MLADITEYYSNETNVVDDHRYKRTANIELEIIGECYLCGVLLDNECEIVVDGKETFCSDRCKGEYEQMEKDGEI